MAQPAEEPSATPKRMLLILYHFGPGCPTGGVRWNVMARDLVSYGWEIDVITVARSRPVDPAIAGPAAWMDQTRVVEVAEPTWPKRAHDALVGIKRRVAGVIRLRLHRCEREIGPDDVRVSDPETPVNLWSNLTATLNSARDWCREMTWVHRATAIPYIADCRDPLVLGEPAARTRGWLDRWLGQRYERRCFKRARVVICNTERAKRAAEEIEEYRSLEITRISNGYAAADDIGIPDPRCFRIVFAGWLYPWMDVWLLMAACARLRARSGLPADRFTLEFMGTSYAFGGVRLAALARSYGLGKSFVLHPRSSREEAQRLQRAAAVSVVFDNLPSLLAIPTKYYDAVQMLGSVLLLGNQDTALNDAARRIGVKTQDPDDDSALDHALDDALERWKKSDFSEPVDKLGIRRHQTERLHQLLSTLNGK